MPSSKTPTKTNRARPSRASRNKKNKKYWVASVKTVSTFPPPGLFTKSASTIAKSLASPEVSPKGPTSGMGMLNYFINRAGRNLAPERRAELEKAKVLLSKRIRRDREARKQKPADQQGAA